MLILEHECPSHPTHVHILILHQINHIPHRKDLMSELAQLNDFDDQLYKVTKGHASERCGSIGFGGW